MEHSILKPLSVTNNSIGSRTAASGNVGAAILTNVARSCRSWIDGVICNWKGLESHFFALAHVINFIWLFGHARLFCGKLSHPSLISQSGPCKKLRSSNLPLSGKKREHTSHVTGMLATRKYCWFACYVTHFSCKKMNFRNIGDFHVFHVNRSVNIFLLQRKKFYSVKIC